MVADPFYGLNSGMVITEDGTVIFGSAKKSLLAVAADGDVLWNVPLGGDVYSAPALAADGTIYLATDKGDALSLSPDGSINWKVAVSAEASAPAVGADGTLYFGTVGGVTALDVSGAKLWSFVGDGVDPSVLGSPTLAADGTIYAAGYSGNVYALNPDGMVKWSFPAKGRCSVVIGSDGALFVASEDATLYVLTPGGQLMWKFDAQESLYEPVALGPDGSVYLSGTSTLYALTPDGTVKWKRDAAPSDYFSSPMVDSAGVVFSAGFSGITAWSPDGDLLWTFATAGACSSPLALGWDGTLFAGCEDGRLYALGP